MVNTINPEVKKSSGIVMVLIIIFMLVMNIGLQLSFNSIKDNYIDGKAALIGRLSEKYPELEGELVEAAFNGSDEEAIIKGKEIIKEYGYSEDLDFHFISPINAAFKESKSLFLIMILAFGATFLGMNYFQYEIIYSRIRNLTEASKNILEGNYDMNIYEEKEGDFAKLSYGFKNMRSIIQSQMLDLNKEKQFLVNLLSDISHQLKTPLSALIVYNDILSKPGISEENKKKFLESSKSQLNRMDWLIKSMLKLAKVDARAINLNIEENNLNVTVEGVIESLKVMAKENNVQLNLKANDESHEKLICKYDERWLWEALINIVKNSIEHSENGEVNITLEETPINSKIIIQDNGEGISSEDLPNIFKRFYKGGKRDSVGIGLSLSKSIVEAQNGYIEVKSEIGAGTEFRVILMKNI